MLTKTDLQNIRELIKDESQTIRKDTVELRTEMLAVRRELRQIKEENRNIKKEFQLLQEHLNDQAVQFKDEILHEIVNLRDDVTVVTGYRDMIEDHDTRIVKLEKTVLYN